MEIRFPRPRDNEPYAWGLSGPEPVEIWERFSPAYEAQLERLTLTLGELGFTPAIGGSGSEDGEYIRAEYNDNSRIVFFYHLEDPADARFIASLDEGSLRNWIVETTRAPDTVGTASALPATGQIAPAGRRDPLS